MYRVVVESGFRLRAGGQSGLVCHRVRVASVFLVAGLGVESGRYVPWVVVASGFRLRAWGSDWVGDHRVMVRLGVRLFGPGVKLCGVAYWHVGGWPFELWSA